jgi:polysaccharide pyruvyl transferase WcaK-like protein
LDRVISLFRLPKGTKPEMARQHLRKELRMLVGRIQGLFKKRNKNFVAAMKKIKSQEAALVIGGAHVNDLTKQLKSAKIGCSVVEPAGYPQDADALLDELIKISK